METTGAYNLMPQHILVRVNGIIYNNVRAAWRAQSPPGLPEITVRKRIASGWLIQDAFNLPAIPPQLRRKGH